MSLDPEILRVAAEVQGPQPEIVAARMAEVLRDTIDQLLDGQHTGRYHWTQLMKTEKTHAGTLVEINLQRAFRFADGAELDFFIAGIEVDCKYSQKLGGWMIPPEAVGQVCMVVWANDDESLWSCGLVRASDQNLSQGTNRDGKRTLSEVGRSAILWMFEKHPLPANVYLRLPEDVVRHILDPAASGRERVDRLFRLAQGHVIGRGAVATAGQQDDFMKRVRENGGSRSALRPEGIVIFGHEHKALTKQLGLASPEKGELVSVRLTPVHSGDPRPSIELEGQRWSVATSSDPVVAAPLLPRSNPFGRVRLKAGRAKPS